MIRRHDVTGVEEVRMYRCPQHGLQSLPGGCGCNRKWERLAEWVPVPESERRPMTYPFPVDGQFVASMVLPADGLSATEAERLSRFVASLVTHDA